MTSPFDVSPVLWATIVFLAVITVVCARHEERRHERALAYVRPELGRAARVKILERRSESAILSASPARLFARGLARFKLGRCGGAREDFRAAIRLRESFDRAHEFAGHVDVAVGRFDRAALAYAALKEDGRRERCVASLQRIETRFPDPERRPPGISGLLAEVLPDGFADEAHASIADVLGLSDPSALDEEAMEWVLLDALSAQLEQGLTSGSADSVCMLLVGYLVESGAGRFVSSSDLDLGDKESFARSLTTIVELSSGALDGMRFRRIEESEDPETKLVTLRLDEALVSAPVRTKKRRERLDDITGALNELAQSRGVEQRFAAYETCRPGESFVVFLEPSQHERLAAVVPPPIE